jgi:hypothetical protein
MSGSPASNGTARTRTRAQAARRASESCLGAMVNRLNADEDDDEEKHAAHVYL